MDNSEDGGLIEDRKNIFKKSQEAALEEERLRTGLLFHIAWSLPSFPEKCSIEAETGKGLVSGGCPRIEI